jgi:hypothetical protein
MRHQGVLQLDRADPLTAGLDDILAAVGDLDETVEQRRGHIAGAQPAVHELLRVVVEVVGAGDSRAADLDLTHRLAVPRQDLAVVVDEP